MRAKKDLQKIYGFYTRTIGEEKAIEDVLESVELLSDAKFVRIGAIDEDFKHLKHQHKKLIEEDSRLPIG